ncbi:hypothetical protein [Dactylosporangium sp. CA-092794]|uniref:hypothetical protein n=1 Tax=Dactylosporangium sp. CA-092794 TaxID=3239929 RepID=UPI003D93523C
MRVTFVRLADHEWGHVAIERDDGVVYHMNTGPLTGQTPHDLVHYTVEDALGIADGIWGAIAGGVVFRSMRHVSGRRPPHAAERSRELIREHRDRLRNAELIGGLCERSADLSAEQLARFVAGEPSLALTVEQLAVAGAALREAGARWSALPVGGRLELRWPGHRRLRAAGPAPAPTEPPARSRSRRGRTTARPRPSAGSRRRTP